MRKTISIDKKTSLHASISYQLVNPNNNQRDLCFKKNILKKCRGATAKSSSLQIFMFVIFHCYWNAFVLTLNHKIDSNEKFTYVVSLFLSTSHLRTQPQAASIFIVKDTHVLKVECI